MHTGELYTYTTEYEGMPVYCQHCGVTYATLLLVQIAITTPEQTDAEHATVKLTCSRCADVLETKFS